jgi:hypothetical protein
LRLPILVDVLAASRRRMATTTHVARDAVMRVS